MDEERLEQAALHAAEILAQAEATAARASRTLDRGRAAGSVAAETLSRARRAEVWAEAAIGRIREVDGASKGFLRPTATRPAASTGSAGSAALTGDAHATGKPGGEETTRPGPA